MSARPAPAVSVCILTKNRLEQLRLCLDAIQPQLHAGDEIVLLDTGSTDGTREFLGKPANDQLRPFNTDKQHDFGSARNELLSHARNPIICFTDDDCYPAPDWLDEVRRAIASSDAAGGPCWPARPYDFPWWWSGSLAWLVGLSPPGLLKQAPGVYPASSNLAAAATLLKTHPFGSTPHALEEDTKYLGGREDATWWRTVQVAGRRRTIAPRAIVFHDIPSTRLSFSYVRNRARADGAAWWQREASPGLAPFLTGGIATGALQVLSCLTRGNFRAAVASVLWFERMASARRSALQSPAPQVREHLFAEKLLHASTRALRREVSRGYFSVKRHLRRPAVWPPKNPQSIYVAAQGYVGDTVLLRPMLQLLSRNFPETEITVSARTPYLVQNCGHNIAIATAGTTPSHRPDVAFAPYYHFGETSLWRDKLAWVGVTFDQDVGFPRDRDYHLAQHKVLKDSSQHELHNLLRLFSLWPLRGDLIQPSLPRPESEIAQLLQQHPVFGDKPLLTVQVDAGDSRKVWPSERFCSLLQALSHQFPDLHIVLLGDCAHQGPAQPIAENLGSRCTNLCGCTLPQMTSALALAQMHLGACSAPKHIAMALGVPTFTLYGPTEPERWGALFEKEKHACVRALPRPLAWEEFHTLPGNYLMSLLTLKEVETRVTAHLQRTLAGLK